MEITEITGVSIDIRNISIEDIQTYQYTPPATPTAPPVVVEIGTPVVDIPGCVEAHESNNKSKTVGGDDERGLVTYCDSGTPSFNPINYEPEQVIITRPSPVPKTRGKTDKSKSEVVKAPEVKPPTIPPTNIECPTQKQLTEEPIGFIFDSGRKVVTGYKLEGTQCIRLVEDVPIIQQAINGLPPTSVVITTGGIAVVATTSALIAKPFADILLKVIKPTVKKVLKKVAAIRGKQLKVQSVRERQAEQRDRNQAIAKLKSVQAKTKK